MTNYSICGSGAVSPYLFLRRLSIHVEGPDIFENVSTFKVLTSDFSPNSSTLNMSQAPASSSIAQNTQTTPPTDSDNFKVIFEAAFKAYKKKTKQNLEGHVLLTQLQTCDSPAAILDLLRGQVNPNADEGLKKWLNPTINVLYAFSATLGGGVGLVNINRCVNDLTLIPMRQIFPPATAIFAGIGVLLLVSDHVYCLLRAGPCEFHLGG
jgi:hypothetical protein